MHSLTRQIYKYPRTPHIEGSRIQPGDEDLVNVPFEQLVGRHLVIEEKMDGANCAVSFSQSGRLRLQSRGHYLTGGKREKHFDLFKTWASTHATALHRVLEHRYIMYGEWLYAKHTIYYNKLPHYFLEFDILDTASGAFLSTPARKALLAPLPFIKSVKILFQGRTPGIQDLKALVGPSHFISEDHIEQLCERAAEQRLNVELTRRETDPTCIMEGLYLKEENQQIVTGRFKYIRASFLTTVLQSRTHWLNRPIISNLLADGANLFGDRT